MALTVRNKLFCIEYIKNRFNGTKAATKAGYSKKTAYSSANGLLKRPEVKAEIARILREQAFITEERIELELAMIAFSRITDFFDIVKESKEINGKEIIFERIRLKNLKRLDTSAIAHIRETREGVHIRMYDKINALEKLGQILGMFKGDSNDNEIIEKKINTANNKLKEYARNLIQLDTTSKTISE